VRAAQDKSFTSPWRGEVGLRSKPGGGESLHVRNITPPLLASSMLADPPPPGEGKKTSIRRRAFLALLGSTTAVAWPLAAHAQQTKPPLIGFLGADPALWSSWTAAFVQRPRELGWIIFVEIDADQIGRGVL